MLGLFAVVHRVEHYEIASHGCVRTYAKLLGHGDGISLLELTLAEEKETDEKLTKLAAEINLFAAESETAETEVDSQHATSKGPRKTKVRRARA
jgi:ferritin-like metal-binding protein YciE